MPEINTLSELFEALDIENKKYLNYDQFKHLLNILKLPIIDDYNNDKYYMKDLFNELDKVKPSNDNIILSKDIIKKKLEDVIDEIILDNILTEKNNVNIFMKKMEEYINI